MGTYALKIPSHGVIGWTDHVMFNARIRIIGQPFRRIAILVPFSVLNGLIGTMTMPRLMHIRLGPIGHFPSLAVGCGGIFAMSDFQMSHSKVRKPRR